MTDRILTSPELFDAFVTGWRSWCAETRALRRGFAGVIVAGIGVDVGDAEQPAREAAQVRSSILRNRLRAQAEGYRAAQLASERGSEPTDDNAHEAARAFVRAQRPRQSACRYGATAQRANVASRCAFVYDAPRCVHPNRCGYAWDASVLNLPPVHTFRCRVFLCIDENDDAAADSPRIVPPTGPMEPCRTS